MPTTEPIIITPMKGLWKYYGQTKTFIENEHFFVSTKEATADISKIKLTIKSEEVGKQPYELYTEDTPDGSATQGQSVTTTTGTTYKIVEGAPDFEVRKYVTKAVVGGIKKVYASKEPITIDAPEGYLISAEGKPDSNWGTSMQTIKMGETNESEESEKLKEGENIFTYYLRSNFEDNTRGAIDQTPKKVIINVDTTPPESKLSLVGDAADVTAEGIIVGNEPGMYYYMVVPAEYAPADVKPDDVLEAVTSGQGIVGYGRLEADKEMELHFKGMTPETKYTVYAVLVDAAGNRSKEVAEMDFETDKMVLEGEVDIAGDVKVDSTLTAKENLQSKDTGDLSFQWYRINLKGDESALNEVVDETGGEKEDDLEAEDDEDDDDEDDGEDEDDEDEIEIASVHKMAEDEDEITTIDDDAVPIAGATSRTYKVTRADIGSRIIVCVTAENYSGYAAGGTTTFVPKLMPTYKLPVIAGAVYSPTRKLSSIKLPAQWSWVDSSIVPVYGNSGYRARFVPADTKVYKTVIVRVKVPVFKKALKKSMVKVSKSVAYKGKAIKNNVKLKDGKKKLTMGKDYKLSYANNKKLGKATVKIKGVGNYKGTVKVTYRIKKKSVKSVTCKYKKVKAFKNKNVTAGLVLKNGDVKMKKNRDYTVQYKNNKEIGRAKIIVRGKGNYTGKRTLRFSIVPSKPKIKKIKRKKTSFKFTLSSKWKVKGYQVFVSTARSFSKSKTQKYVTTGNNFGVYSLKKKSTYYVRVKAYQTKKGKSYLSAYSGVKKIKLK